MHTRFSRQLVYGPTTESSGRGFQLLRVRSTDSPIRPVSRHRRRSCHHAICPPGEASTPSSGTIRAGVQARNARPGFCRTHRAAIAPQTLLIATPSDRPSSPQPADKASADSPHENRTGCWNRRYGRDGRDKVRKIRRIVPGRGCEVRNRWDISTPVCNELAII